MRRWPRAKKNSPLLLPGTWTDGKSFFHTCFFFWKFACKWDVLWKPHPTFRKKLLTFSHRKVQRKAAFHSFSQFFTIAVYFLLWKKGPPKQSLSPPHLHLHSQRIMPPSAGNGRKHIAWKLHPKQNRGEMISFQGMESSLYPREFFYSFFSRVAPKNPVPNHSDKHVGLSRDARLTPRDLPIWHSFLPPFEFCSFCIHIACHSSFSHLKIFGTTYDTWVFAQKVTSPQGLFFTWRGQKSDTYITLGYEQTRSPKIHAYGKYSSGFSFLTCVDKVPKNHFENGLRNWEKDIPSNMAVEEKNGMGFPKFPQNKGRTR